MKSDSEIRDDVIEELRWEPRISDPDAIGVAVRDGAVTLTGGGWRAGGMDGVEGARAVRRAGGTVVAQDEESSVLYGMPRAVAQAGLCSAILPLPEIGRVVNRLFSGDAP